MKKVIAMILSLALLLSCVSALALETVDPDAVMAGAKIEAHNDLLELASTVTPIDQIALNFAGGIPLSTYKSSPVACPQIVCGVSSSTTDDELKMWKQLGFSACELSIGDDELSYEVLYPLVEKLRNFEQGGFEILLASNYTFQKDRIIHLQLEGWEEEIEKFNDYLRLMDRLNIRTVAVAWQPNGISRTGDVPTGIHGANAGATDMNKIDPYELKNDRLYTKEEMWQTFGDFLERVLPVCAETNVRIALHPNDPPVDYLGAVGSLITCTDDYRRAFELAGDSPYLGIKLCTGCWLEGGVNFTKDLTGDIEEFVRRGKVFEVHFRNVSAPLYRDESGYFEETLIQDGYADMYEIMKTFIRAGYNGPIFCDHTHKMVNNDLGSKLNRAAADSAIIGLIYAARSQVTSELYALTK